MSATAERIEPQLHDDGLAPWLASIDRTFSPLPRRRRLPDDAAPTLWVGRLLHAWLLEQAERMPLALGGDERLRLIDAIGALGRAKLELWLMKLAVYEVNLARSADLLQGDCGRQRLAHFGALLQDDARLLDVYRRSPVLIGRIVRHFQLMLGFVGALARDLHADRAALEQQFGIGGTLDRVELGKGDPHLGARQVAVLHFERGSVVYKPRSLAIDALYGELAERIGPALDHRLRTPRCMLRDGYGWQEFIQSGTGNGNAAAERFYYSIGAHLALLHFVNASDIHFDNLLSTSAGEPVLFDLETAFSNSYAEGAAGVQRAMHEAVQLQLERLGRSVLKTGILPSNSGDAGAFNALTDVDQRDTVTTVDVLVDADSDTVRIERRVVPMPIRCSLPEIDGRRTRPLDYLDSLLDGFDAAYRECLRTRDALRGHIARNADCRVRAVLRNTSMYGMFLMESTHPVYAGDPRRLNGLFAKLGIITEFQPAFRAVLDEEIAQLMQFDVPAFGCRLDGSTLSGFSGSGMAFHGRAPLDTFGEVADEYGDDDRVRQQRLITRTMGRTRYPRIDPGSGTDPVEALVGAAVEFLDDTATYSEADRTVSWLQIAVPEEGGDVLPLPPTLYAGDAGMLLALSAIARHTPNAAARRMHACLQTMVRREAEQAVAEGLSGGLFQGAAGALYALLQDARLHEDAAGVARAHELTSELLRNAPPPGCDIIDGTAGVMLLLCHLAESDRGGPFAAALSGLADHLLHARDADALGWSSSHGRALGGFSHGASGIAHALLSAGRLLGREDCCETGLQAIAFEDRRFDAMRANWPDLRAGTAATYNDSWCNGTPGYLLTRAIHYQRLDERSRANFGAALERFVRAPRFQDDSLCHGSAGGLDVLVTLRALLPDLVDVVSIDRVLAGLTGRTLHSGSVDCDAPGLMSGIAGIAYAALRVRHPTLQSVLSVYG